MKEMSFNLFSNKTSAITVKEAINKAVKKLEAFHIENARQNANLMLSKILDIPYSKLPLSWTQKLSTKSCNLFSEMLNRRCNHEPLQYILGEWSFLDFDVTSLPGALIPRPETEEVFMAGAGFIKEKVVAPDFTFADIGTGTGILGIAMAKYFPQARGSMVDISEEALKIAKINVERFQEIKDRVKLIKSNLLDSFAPESLDIIISNPPYIDSEEVKTLMPEVVGYEPHLALDGGPGGLVILEKLLKQSEVVLKAGGLIIFEHGHGQREAIKRLLSPIWSVIKAGDDLAGKERFFVLMKAKDDKN